MERRKAYEARRRGEHEKARTQLQNVSPPRKRGTSIDPRDLMFRESLDDDNDVRSYVSGLSMGSAKTDPGRKSKNKAGFLLSNLLTKVDRGSRSGDSARSKTPIKDNTSVKSSKSSKPSKSSPLRRGRSVPKSRPGAGYSSDASMGSAKSFRSSR